MAVAEMMCACWEKHVRPEHYGWTMRLLTNLYAEPGRFYHTREHVADCLRLLGELREDPHTPTSIDVGLAELALLWHDAVCVPGNSDNELNSVCLLEGLRMTLTEPLHASKTIPLIFATCHQRTIPPVSEDPTMAAVVDIDLAVLGRDIKGYARYVTQVRREYAFVSDAAWRTGRITFLVEMLARQRIYHLAPTFARFETAARRNMRGELEQLRRTA